MQVHLSETETLEVANLSPNDHLKRFKWRTKDGREKHGRLADWLHDVMDGNLEEEGGE